MHKCSNQDCSHFIDIEIQSFIRLEFGDGVRYVCSTVSH